MDEIIINRDRDHLKTSAEFFKRGLHLGLISVPEAMNGSMIS